MNAKALNIAGAVLSAIILVMIAVSFARGWL
jgi:hypothetical protein